MSLPFSVQRKDQARLRRLVDKFGGGSRTEFLRVAMERMEVAERADDLRWLQSYGTARAVEAGLTGTTVAEVVRRRLNPMRGRRGPGSRATQLTGRMLAEAAKSRYPATKLPSSSTSAPWSRLWCAEAEVRLLKGGPARPL